MFQQWMEKMLQDFSEQNPDGHPPVMKGHALVLYTQLRDLTMMCYANTLKPEKRPGLRYAVNPALCAGCKVVHSRLDDSSFYATATEDCWTPGCLHKSSDQQQAEIKQRRDERRIVSALPSAYFLYGRRPCEQSRRYDQRQLHAAIILELVLGVYV